MGTMLLNVLTIICMKNHAMSRAAMEDAKVLRSQDEKIIHFGSNPCHFYVLKSKKENVLKLTASFVYISKLIHLISSSCDLREAMVA